MLKQGRALCRSVFGHNKMSATRSAFASYAKNAPLAKAAVNNMPIPTALTKTEMREDIGAQ
jgi:hypothetical protein